MKLNVATAGTEVKQDTNVDGVAGSQNLVIGKSGGQANLFGNIPGKPYGIDVTVNLATKINSILRSMDPDFVPLIGTNPWPTTWSACRQAYTGAVQNYITGVHLTGNLHVKAADGTPMANVMLSLLHRLGLDDLKSFGDSTGEFDLNHEERTV